MVDQGALGVIDIKNEVSITAAQFFREKFSFFEFILRNATARHWLRRIMNCERASRVYAEAISKQEAHKMGTFHNLEFKSINGKTVKMSDYKGKTLLIVNTASKCGYTPQYKGLQELYDKFKQKDFLILGFPSNDFGAQEPGSEDEIEQFCEINFGVNFPLFMKSVVKGEGKNPIYKFLIENSETHDEVKWNFEKFLVGKDGQVLSRFGSKVEPLSSEMLEKIEKAVLR